MTGQDLAPPWSRRSASLIWRDPYGVIRAFPRIEDPVLVPVYVAFLMHYLGGWAPFGACRGCAPMCRSQLVPRAEPPPPAAGLFNLGMLAVLMRIRMWPRGMWRRPPQPLFLIYKFFASLFFFEFGNNCMWKAVERTLYEGIPLLCESIMGSVALEDFPEVLWLLDSACGAAISPCMQWWLIYALSLAFFWCALSAARFLTTAQLSAHYFVALMSSAAVFYKTRYTPPCTEEPNMFWGR